MKASAHLNPFRVDRLESIVFRFPEGMSWEDLESRLEKLGGRGSIVGAHGSGKTTLIEEWIQRLESRGEMAIRIRLNRETRGLAPWQWSLLGNAASGSFLFVDGAEQLGLRAWWRLVRVASRFRRMVVTTHRRGKLPILLETRVFPGLAERILSDLVTPEKIETYRPMLKHALKKCGGNLREALFDLYDLEAGRRGKFSARYDGVDS